MNHRLSADLLEDATASSVFVEFNARASSGSMAQPVFALAHGNVFRAQNGQDRLFGILGLSVPRTETAWPLSEVDIRYGELRPAEAEKSIALSSQQSALSPTPAWAEGIHPPVTSRVRG